MSGEQLYFNIQFVDSDGDIIYVVSWSIGYFNHMFELKGMMNDKKTNIIPPFECLNSWCHVGLKGSLNSRDKNNFFHILWYGFDSTDSVWWKPFYVFTVREKSDRSTSKIYYPIVKKNKNFSKVHNEERKLFCG